VKTDYILSTGGPASVRLVTSTLARLSQGRCLVLDQRLSPQNPFPAALIDVLIAYLSLLYPPPGSFHDAVLPKDIVLAGDSSGGNLCLAFLLLVQYFQNKPRPGIIFHNTYVSIPYPAGISVFGAHCDATSSL
jgi:acetyl esterase/lipase